MTTAIWLATPLFGSVDLPLEETNKLIFVYPKRPRNGHPAIILFMLVETNRKVCFFVWS